MTKSTRGRSDSDVDVDDFFPDRIGKSSLIVQAEDLHFRL